MKKWLCLIVLMLLLPASAMAWAYGDDIQTAQDLVDALNYAINAPADSVIELNITADLTMTSSIQPPEDNFAASCALTINGNGHKINGLTKPLFSKVSGGIKSITINQLTIVNPNITSAVNDLSAVGAFIAYTDTHASAPTVLTLFQCKVQGGTVASSSYTGGLIGYNAASNVVLEECSVEGVNISGGNSTGGLMGQAASGSPTIKVINCEVKNNTITSSSVKDERTGILFGTMSAAIVEVTATSEGNTVTQNGAAVYGFFGRFGDSNGKITVKGGSYDAKTFNVSTGNQLIIAGGSYAGDPSQVAGVTVDGNISQVETSGKTPYSFGAEVKDALANAPAGSTVIVKSLAPVDNNITVAAGVTVQNKTGAPIIVNNEVVAVNGTYLLPLPVVPSSVPQTGDSTPIALYAGLMLATLAAALMLGKRKTA